MDGFQAEVLRRLPLAQAVLRGIGYALDPPTLDALFAEYRGRCYEDVFRFPSLVALILDALTTHQGSGHRAFVAAAQCGTLPVAEQNAYGKLARIPEALSMALLRTGSTRLRDVLPVEPTVALPASLAGLQLIAFDGKKLKHAAKRLKVLRGRPGKLLGGKLLVALDVAAALVLAFHGDPDGERNDVPLVAPLVAQVRELVPTPILWLGDRQFGNLVVPAQLTARAGDHFLLRCPKSLKLAADPQRPAVSGVDAAGRTVQEEWGWLGTARDPRRRYVRRITLRRPGEEAILLITDLTDATLSPAADLLAAYLCRWGIERVFQEVTEVFDLQRLIGATPRAMIFQAALCFLLYDLIQVVRAYVAADGAQPRAGVSSEKLFWGVRDELGAWRRLGTPELAAQALALGTAERTAPPMAAWLRETLRGSWQVTYRKAPPKHKPPPGAAGIRAKVPRGHGGHSSTWRILQAAKAAARSNPRS
jgi:hypothetical protein